MIKAKRLLHYWDHTKTNDWLEFEALFEVEFHALGAEPVVAHVQLDAEIGPEWTDGWESELYADCPIDDRDSVTQELYSLAYEAGCMKPEAEGEKTPEIEAISGELELVDDEYDWLPSE